MKAGTAWYVAELDPTYKNHLENTKAFAKGLNDAGKAEATAHIRGYLTALEDARIISPVQSRALKIYYTNF